MNTSGPAEEDLLFTYKCSHCRHQIDITRKREQYIDKWVKCPGCKQNILIQAPTAQPHQPAKVDPVTVRPARPSPPDPVATPPTANPIEIAGPPHRHLQLDDDGDDDHEPEVVESISASAAAGQPAEVAPEPNRKLVQSKDDDQVLTLPPADDEDSEDSITLPRHLRRQPDPASDSETGIHRAEQPQDPAPQNATPDAQALGATLAALAEQIGNLEQDVDIAKRYRRGLDEAEQRLKEWHESQERLLIRFSRSIKGSKDSYSELEQKVKDLQAQREALMKIVNFLETRNSTLISSCTTLKKSMADWEQFTGLAVQMRSVQANVTESMHAFEALADQLNAVEAQSRKHLVGRIPQLLDAFHLEMQDWQRPRREVIPEVKTEVIKALATMQARVEDWQARNGVQRIAPQPGEAYDSNRHEVLSIVSTREEAKVETIQQLTMAGYAFDPGNGEDVRVLRRAKIVLWERETPETPGAGPAHF